MTDKLLKLDKLPEELKDLIVMSSESFKEGYTMVKVVGISTPLHFKHLSELRVFLTLYIPSYKIAEKEKENYECRLRNALNERRVYKTVSRDRHSRVR